MSISTVFYHGTLFLLHPELRSKDRKYVELRGGWWNFFFPDSEQIHWYGDMIRDDGGLGMYATRDQHQQWPNKYVSDIKPGPG